MTGLADYYYPNELADLVLWAPVLFAYTLLISGADLLILSSVAYVSKRLTKAIPLLSMLGISFFSVVLLGPLADLHSPQRAPLIFLLPHLSSTPSNPGLSLIAFQTVIWILTLALAIVFALLTFSYYAHLKALESTGLRRLFYLAFSLGVKTEAAYAKLRPITTAVAIALLPPATMWGLYPATLLTLQTWNFVWRNWITLPALYFADTFVVATAVAIFVYFVWKVRRMEREVIDPLLKVHAAGSISVAALTSLQLGAWWFWFSGSPEAGSLAGVVPIMYLVIVLLTGSFLASLVALKYPSVSILVSLIALAGTFSNKWNILINGQLVSKTGLSVFELRLPPDWLLSTIAPIAMGVFIMVVLSFLFPLEVREVGK